ncbi:Scr1 family TA system antitoxin-like transcriptional regulator [Micromonospora sp. RP3T]|uniref:Scr1 family TA system antitoxin-like transcriptional regulator n=1 Tax=Micromonospora sp. RP3T TaxID=2135446 RepID=UPI001E2E01CD|nr:Scr1 family TA system antitoxin-like transcriptional regulator [Micromonospora sp. RP3T]
MGSPRPGDGRGDPSQDRPPGRGLRLHVLPLDIGAHLSLGGGFAIAELPGGEHMLCLDNPARGQIADHPEWIRLMLRKWEILLGEALPERASLDLVHKLKVTP